MKRVANYEVYVRMVLIFILAVFSFLPSAAQTQSNDIIIAKTKAPKLLDDEGGLSFGLSEKEYMELSRKISATSPNFVGVKKKPARLTSAALFGFNIVIQKKNLSWVLDRNEKNEYVIYADLNADGNLSNDKPLNFRKIDGRYVTEVHKTLTATVNNRRRKYSYDLRLEVEERTLPDKPEKETVLKIQGNTMRRGILNLNNRTMAFALIGSNGTYDYDFNRLYLDLDGDEKFDSKIAYSLEVFMIGEKFINIGDRSYEFSVDRHGDNLTLKPLDKKMPERADLRIGSIAPDFSFKDLDDNLRRLSDFRGKIVLLDVWGIWCAPCVKEVPQLSAFYKNLKQKNFEIISLDQDDELPNLRKFIVENQMNWIHTKIDEAFLNLYRVNKYPTYFLIDKDGKIVSNTLRAGEEMYKKIEELAAF